MFRSRAFGFVTFAFLVFLSPLWLASSALNAQACTTRDPPCPTDLPPTMMFSPAPGLYSSTSLTVTVDFFDDHSLSSSTPTFSPAVFNRATDTRYIGTIQLQSGSNTVVTATICDNHQQCTTNTVAYGYALPPPPPPPAAPTISLAPYNGENRDVSHCALMCFDNVLQYRTPTYTSLDVERSVTLVYSPQQMMRRAMIQVDATDNSNPAPDKLSILLLRNDGTWQTFTNNQSEIFFAGGSGTSRLGAQFDVSTLSTGAYNYTVVVRGWRGASKLESTAPIRILVARETASPFGSGWWIAGLQRVITTTGGVVVTNGDGSIAFFAACPTGCDTFVSPTGDYTTLTRRAGGNGYDRLWPDGSKVGFDAQGRMTSTEDRFANRTTYAYAGTTLQLTSITDPIGQVTTLGYDANGKLDFIRDPGSRLVDVTVNAAGDLVQIVDPDNVRALQVVYNAVHEIQSTTDRLGGTWDYGYDFVGKLSTVTQPSIIAEGGPMRPVSGFRSLESRVMVDPSSGQGTVDNPAIARKWPYLLRAATFTPKGDSTVLTLDRWGTTVLAEYHDPRGVWVVASWGYNTQGQLTSVNTPQGGRATFGWTGPDLTSIYNVATGRLLQFEFEPVYHQVKKLSIRLCNGCPMTLWAQNFFDASNRLERTESGTSITRYTWDGRGRPLTVTDPKGHVTSTSYQSAAPSNVQSVTAIRGDGVSHPISYGYDNLGRLTLVTDAAGRTFGKSYDALNRVMSASGPLSSAMQFTYDDVTRTYTFTDPKGQLYTTIHNALGWTTAETDARGLSSYLSYDRNGNITSFTNRRGQVTQSSFDDVDRVTSVTADAKTTSLYYDPAGQWMAVTNDESSDTVRIDVDRRPVEVLTWRGALKFRLSFSYDPDGRRNSAKIEGLVPAWGPREFHWGYNPVRRFNYLEDLAGQPTGLVYSEDQTLDTLKFPIVTSGTNTLREQLTYGQSHLLQQLGFNWTAHDTVVGRRYLYDALERVTRVTRGRRPIANPPPYADEVRRVPTYDQLGRIATYKDYRDWEQKGTFVCPNPQDKTTCAWTTVSNTTLLREDAFTYDLVGNRSDHGGVVETGNRLTSFDGYTLQYDADGNLTSKTKAGVWSQTFSWNSLGQLVQVVTNGVTTTFGYDGFGRRVRKTTNGVVTRYMWDRDDLIAELDGSGMPIREYVYYPGIDQPHSVRRSSDGAVFYYTMERPGHVTGLINTSNQRVNRYEYTPWGEPLTVTEGVAQPLRYGAREYDSETGLYYNRARYYDPKVGRFISEDPIGLLGGVNAYIYASADPMNATDPTGLVDVRCDIYDVYREVQFTRNGPNGMEVGVESEYIGSFAICHKSYMTVFSEWAQKFGSTLRNAQEHFNHEPGDPERDLMCDYAAHTVNLGRNRYIGGAPLAIASVGIKVEHIPFLGPLHYGGWTLMEGGAHEATLGYGAYRAMGCGEARQVN